MKRGNSRGKPWYGNRNFQQKKAKPSFTIPSNNAAHDSDDGLNPSQIQSNTSVSFSTDREPGAFVGWKLYFPDKRKLNHPQLSLSYFKLESFSLQGIRRSR